MALSALVAVTSKGWTRAHCFYHKSRLKEVYSVMNHPENDRRLLAPMALLTVGIFALDLLFPLAISGGVPYVFVILFSTRTRSQRYVWYLAIITTCLVVLGYFLSAETGITWMIILKRILSLLSIWGTTILLVKFGDRAPTHGRFTRERFRPLLLVLIMTIVAIIVGSIAFSILYNEAITHAQQPLVDIRGPFVRAGLLALSSAMLVVLAGSLLFLRISTPIIMTLEYQHKILSTILNTASIGIITIDESGIIISLNKASEDLFGYTANEVIGKNINILMPNPHHSEHNRYIKNYLKTGQAKIIGKEREALGLHKNGNTFPVELAVSEFLINEQHLFTGIVTDITERKFLEKEILNIVTEEQRHIGQELHDGVGQELTGLSLYAAALIKRLDSEGVTALNDAQSMYKIRNAAAKVSDGLIEVQKHVKELARGMIPVQVDAEGLTAALEQLVRSTDQIEGISCIFDYAEAVETHNVNTSTNLYRIAQEAVNNALTHSQATEIHIGFHRDDGQLTITISDNGVGLGFHYPDMETGKGEMNGMGLRIMRHRAKLIGATLTIGSQDQKSGTTVRCVVMDTQ